MNLLLICLLLIFGTPNSAKSENNFSNFYSYNSVNKSVGDNYVKVFKGQYFSSNFKTELIPDYSVQYENDLMYVSPESVNAQSTFANSVLLPLLLMFIGVFMWLVHRSILEKKYSRVFNKD